MSEEGFAERLKRYRREKGMTQQELADELGVSNKTISRWESGGGYPDVGLLVPLAKALGVTVDDLLNEEKPVRTLTKGDWQSLLSFAFAVGGGLLFFLLSGAVPAVLCYLLYLACLGYGVYLQRHYSFRSGWFLLSAMVVNFFVNFQAAMGLRVLWFMFLWIKRSGSLDMSWDGTELLDLLGVGSLLVVLAIAVVLTAVTWVVICKKGGLTDGDKQRPFWRLRWSRPTLRRWLPALFPLALCASLLPLYDQQKPVFYGLLAAMAVVCVVLYMKKGERLRLIPAGVLMALCALLPGTVTYAYQSKINGQLYYGTYDEAFFNVFLRPAWGTWLAAAVLAAAWLAVSGLRLERKLSPPKPDSPDEGDETL